MNINKNIRKALFAVEKTTLLVILLIVTVNLTINGLISFFDTSTTSFYFIQQLLINSIVFSFVYLMIYAINNVVTSVPFLVSLNCPGRLLGKNIIFTGFIRGILITLLFLLIKIVVFKIGFTPAPFVISALGMNLNSIDLGNILILAGLICLVMNFTYSMITLISLLGVKFGWQYVLSAVFIILGIFFLLLKSIVLLFIFGWQLGMFSLGLLILVVVLNLLNYRLIKGFEYKY